MQFPFNKQPILKTPFSHFRQLTISDCMQQLCNVLQYAENKATITWYFSHPQGAAVENYLAKGDTQSFWDTQYLCLCWSVQFQYVGCVPPPVCMLDTVVHAVNHLHLLTTCPPLLGTVLLEVRFNI